MFGLEERPAGWVHEAPIKVIRLLHLPADAETAFAVLADLGGWPAWYRGLTSSTVEGPATGVGATRVVKVGLTSFRERFLAWDEPHRLELALIGSTTPGLRAMAEEWLVEPAGDDRTRLRLTVGVELHPVLHLAAPVLRAFVARQVAGADGLADLLRLG